MKIINLKFISSHNQRLNHGTSFSQLIRSIYRLKFLKMANMRATLLIATLFSMQVAFSNHAHKSVTDEYSNTIITKQLSAPHLQPVSKLVTALIETSSIAKNKKSSKLTLKKRFIVRNKNLAQGMPLWVLLPKVVKYSSQNTPQNSYLKQKIISPKNYVTWFAAFACSLLLTFTLLHQLQKNQTIKKHLQLQPLRIKQYLFITTFLMSAILSKFAFHYLGLILFTTLLFRLKIIRFIFKWLTINRNFFLNLTIFILSANAIYLCIQSFLQTLTHAAIFIQLLKSCFTVIILISGMCFINAFCRLNNHISWVEKYTSATKIIYIIMSAICVSLDLFGYHSLALHVTLSFVVTILAVLISTLINIIIVKVYNLLCEDPEIKKHLIYYFGYKKDQIFSEFLILKWATQVIVTIFSLYFITKYSGLANYFINDTYVQIVHGIHLGTTIINPTRIVLGLLIYCLLYLIFRGLSARIKHRYQNDDTEEDTQVVLASIFSYLGFGISLIAGLLIAGFDFTGLAIIAGALSVGIGLGLQSVVNNFVSGLILLIEKPIKPGDRINIDGVEGFVKKIRVRSTQILTPSREDIIIPNSDLITRRVTNYMYTDRYCRISCEVSVAHGSNTRLVQDILLQIANNHTEVLKDKRNQPTVFFKSFTDYGLKFELCCLINNVNKKATVQSDLNFAIDQKFNEYKISLATQKQHIYLKNLLE